MSYPSCPYTTSSLPSLIPLSVPAPLLFMQLFSYTVSPFSSSFLNSLFYPCTSPIYAALLLYRLSLLLFLPWFPFLSPHLSYLCNSSLIQSLPSPLPSLIPFSIPAPLLFMQLFSYTVSPFSSSFLDSLFYPRTSPIYAILLLNRLSLLLFLNLPLFFYLYSFLFFPSPSLSPNLHYPAFPFQ